MKQETLFDHRPTEGELTELFLVPLTAEEYLTRAPDPDTILGDLFRLYQLRGDKPTADRFLVRVKDRAYAFNLQLVDVEH